MLQGHYTLDTRCEYTTNDVVQHLEVNRLRRNEAEVWCVCGVVSLSNSNGDHVTVNPSAGSIGSPELTCSLIIKRCPQKINMF